MPELRRPVTAHDAPPFRRGPGLRGSPCDHYLGTGASLKARCTRKNVRSGSEADILGRTIKCPLYPLEQTLRGVGIDVR